MNANSEEGARLPRATETELIANEPQILPTEVDEVYWREFLTQFEEQIYPIFKNKGYSLGEALIVWQLNKAFNTLDHIEEHLCDNEG